jgi:hypothetical protein
MGGWKGSSGCEDSEGRKKERRRKRSLPTSKKKKVGGSDKHTDGDKIRTGKCKTCR